VTTTCFARCSGGGTGGGTGPGSGGGSLLVAGPGNGGGVAGAVVVLPVQALAALLLSALDSRPRIPILVNMWGMDLLVLVVMVVL